MILLQILCDRLQQMPSKPSAEFHKQAPKAGPGFPPDGRRGGIRVCDVVP